MPTAIGRFGFAVSATATVDTISREATAFHRDGAGNLAPVRSRAHQPERWAGCSTAFSITHFFTYGAGFDWVIHGPWISPRELFGQTGRSEFGSIVKPRWQTGLRFRPVDAFSVDLIYGRNITGENANWLTLAATIRFSEPR